MATYSSTLAWEIPWTEEPGGYSPRGSKDSDKTKHAFLKKQIPAQSAFPLHWRGRQQA